MSGLSLRAPEDLLKESTAVTVGAGVAGLVVASVGGLPLGVGAVAAALFGGTIGAALTRSSFSTAMKGIVGVVGGTISALGVTALAMRFGLPHLGLLVGGTMGGLALGALLSVDGGGRMSQATGSLLGALLGIAGTEAGIRVAAFAESTDASPVLSSTVIAGLLGLWVSAGSGARRLERAVDPLVRRAALLIPTLSSTLRVRAEAALAVYLDVLKTLLASDEAGPATTAETREHAERLFSSALDTVESLVRLDRDLGGARPADIEQRLVELQKKTDATSDAVTLGHLARATQALRAQKSALDGLKVGHDRADACLDAQAALLERLRLAVAQYQASDRERFQLELSAVAEQVSRLSDDLDSLSSAIAEAESFQDRRILADVEKAGRRALETLTDPARQRSPHRADAALSVEEEVVRH